MDPIVWEREPPQLRSPVLVASFSGWNDAASAASTALGAIAASLETELIARIDPEEFFDFQANRPTIEISDGELQGVEWPDNLIVAATAEGAERDLLLISGTEPSTRWRGFCNSVLDVAERCGVESVVTFGSLIADVAHTRPVPITGLATDEDDDRPARLRGRRLRGPDRGARDLPRGLPRARDERREPLGRRPPLRRRRPQPEGGPGAAAPARGHDRHRRRGDRARGGGRPPSSSRSPRPSRPTPRSRRWSSGSRSSRTRSPGFTQEDVPSGDAIAQEFQSFLRQQND